MVVFSLMRLSAFYSVVVLSYLPRQPSFSRSLNTLSFPSPSRRTTLSSTFWRTSRSNSDTESRSRIGRCFGMDWTWRRGRLSSGTAGRQDRRTGTQWVSRTETVIFNICELAILLSRFTVLDPLYKLDYARRNKWEDDWIEETK